MQDLSNTDETDSCIYSKGGIAKGYDTFKVKTSNDGTVPERWVETKIRKQLFSGNRQVWFVFDLDCSASPEEKNLMFQAITLQALESTSHHSSTQFTIIYQTQSIFDLSHRLHANLPFDTTHNQLICDIRE